MLNSIRRVGPGPKAEKPLCPYSRLGRVNFMEVNWKFLGSRLAAILVLALAIALAAPALAQSGAPRPGQPKSGLSGQPKTAGQVFRAIYPRAPKNLDPQAPPDPAAWPVIMAAYNRLMTLEPGSAQVSPSVAKTVRVSDDGLKYTFILNEGLTFADGYAVDSQAALFTFDRLMSGEVGKLYYPHLTGLEIVGPYTFRLILDKPWPPFLASLAMPQASLISPGLAKKAPAFLEHNTLGGGRYTVYDWQGETIGLRARTDVVSQPMISFAMFHYEPDPARRYEKMARHGAHLAVEPSVPADGPPDNYVNKDVLSFSACYLAFNTQRPYTRLSGARRALRPVIQDLFKDRPGHLGGVFPAGMNPEAIRVAPAVLDADLSAEELAGRALREIGPPAVPLTLVFKEGEHSLKAEAALIAARLKDYGIPVNVKPLEGSLGQKIFQEGDYDLYLDIRRPEMPSPEMWLGRFLDSRSSVGGNPAWFKNSDADRLIDDITGQTSGRERAARLADLADLADSESPYAFLYQVTVPMVVDKRLAKEEPHPMWPEVWPLDQSNLNVIVNSRRGDNPTGRPDPPAAGRDRVGAGVGSGRDKKPEREGDEAAPPTPAPHSLEEIPASGPAAGGGLDAIGEEDLADPRDYDFQAGE